VTTIVFVGGDERQARASAAIASPSGIELISIQPRWTCNWKKTLAEVRRHASRADALAISTDVPTLLGRELRRFARRNGIPWVAGRARGRDAILALIGRAAEVRRQVDMRETGRTK
jgi:hypothetical protein